MKWRITILIICFGISYLFLISRLYNIQFNQNAHYVAEAESQQIASGGIKPNRGNIYFTDKNNNLIQAVLNKEYPLIYAVPKEIREEAKKRGISAQNYAEQLAPIINQSASDLEKKFNKPNSLFELLVFKAADNQVEAVDSLNLKGIYIKNQISRYYPFGDLASHLLGFVSPLDGSEAAGSPYDEKGRYGIEAFFDKELRGESGEIKGDKIISSSDGKNFVLTIDRNIQAESEEILKKLIGNWEAEAGSIIVQNPRNGKILAMTSFPDFDPNNYSKSDIKNFLNPAVQAIYEPGSVFKIITMAAGIDSGKITPDTIYIDTGSAIINGRKIMNWDKKAHGLQTMGGVIEQSINTGSIFAEKTMGHDIFYDYLKKFNFDKLTNIELPGELKGDLRNLKKGKDVNFATASFGQGIAVTPVRLITAVSAIANGGSLMKPLILNDGKEEVVGRVISEETARKVANMMVSAVKKNIIADIPNYSVAGKTGTAFVPDFVKGGYTEEVINTYVGFAPACVKTSADAKALADKSAGKPACNPKFVILIKLDKPAGAPLAGQTVVPAFRELAQFILNYYNIAPDGL